MTGPGGWSDLRYDRTWGGGLTCGMTGPGGWSDLRYDVI
jgi:hypothetical protein